jgi:predicted DNA binding CopG/RHH family protein
MKKVTGYSKAPASVARAIREAEIVTDFLPPPAQLERKEDNVRITLDLSRRSVSLFRKYARNRGLKYQRMIRNLVDGYAERAFSGRR